VKSHGNCFSLGYKKMSKIKAVLFDLDDTLFDYQTVHDKTLIKLFDRISKITNTPVEMVKLAFELAQKEVKKQLIGTAASHNRDLYFQKLFELLNSQIKNKIEVKYIVELFKLYWDTFFKNIKKDKHTIEVLKFLKSN
jgi:FMN phosphatase YigB (HAD superfamily)